MPILERILTTLGDGRVEEVCIGIHWTAVVAYVGGIRQCGLAATLTGTHTHTGLPNVPEAGKLERFSARELAQFLRREAPELSCIGMAAMNALLAQNGQDWQEADAEQLILQHGSGKRVAVVGHFPFVPELRLKIKDLSVLELDPQEGDLPADMAPEVLPRAEVIAITGMTLMNRTLPNLLKLCPPGAYVMVIGPSTPLSPVLFEFGVDVISGAVVEAIDPVLKTIKQGGNFKQVHRAGVKLVNFTKN